MTTQKKSLYISIPEQNSISFNEAFRRHLSFLVSAYYHVMACGSKLVGWLSESARVREVFVFLNILLSFGVLQ